MKRRNDIARQVKASKTSSILLIVIKCISIAEQFFKVIYVFQNIRHAQNRLQQVFVVSSVLVAWLLLSLKRVQHALQPGSERLEITFGKNIAIVVGVKIVVFDLLKSSGFEIRY